MNNIFDLNFPGELAGADVEGVDVQMLALDAMRLLEYFAREADFTPEQYAVLREIERDLPKVIAGVEQKHRRYFEAIERSVKDVIASYHRVSGKEPS